MRRQGNAIQTYYGQFVVNTPPNGGGVTSFGAASTSVQLTSVTGQPAVVLVNSASAANARVWQWLAGSSFLSCRIVDDAGNSASGLQAEWCGVSRTGNVVTGVRFVNGLQGPTGGSSTVVGNVFSGTPVVVKTGAYTFNLGDEGKLFQLNTATTYTIPSNSATAFAEGCEIDLYNTSGGPATVAITTDTLIFVPSGATGSRTIASGGYCRLKKLGLNSWILIGGQGVT